MVLLKEASVTIIFNVPYCNWTPYLLLIPSLPYSIHTVSPPLSLCSDCSPFQMCCFHLISPFTQFVLTVKWYKIPGNGFTPLCGPSTWLVDRLSDAGRAAISDGYICCSSSVCIPRCVKATKVFLLLTCLAGDVSAPLFMGSALSLQLRCAVVVCLYVQNIKSFVFESVFKQYSCHSLVN